MRQEPRRKLTDLIRKYGLALLDNQARCGALLNDYLAGECFRERFVLNLAHAEGVPTELRRLSSTGADDARDLLIAAQAHRLVEKYGLSGEAAFWAIESWAQAVGILQETRGMPSPTASLAPGSAGHVEVVGIGSYTSLVEALSNAHPGACIKVAPGRYVGQLVIDKAVDIIGSGPPEEIVVECNDDTCVDVQTPTRTSIQGLTIRGSIGDGRKSAPAIWVRRGHLRLDGCVVTCGGQSAIRLHGSRVDASIRDCIVSCGAGVAIEVVGVLRCLVADTHIVDSDFGVTVEGTNSSVMRGCVIRGARRSAVRLSGATASVIDDCVIEDCVTGAIIGGQSKPIFQRSRIVRAGDTGINLKEGSECVLEGCEILDPGQFGIRAVDGSSVRANHCTVSRAGSSGLRLEQSSGALEDCEVSHNHYAGIQMSRGRLSVTRSDIQHNARAGIHAVERSEADLNQCQLKDNRSGNWYCDDTSVVRENSRFQ